MPWYFYTKTGNLVSPRSPSVLASGTVIFSPLPYTVTPPDGFLFCNGQSVLKNDYLDLFGEIGTAFGSVNINEFNVPDLKSRMPRGITALIDGVGSISGVGGSKIHIHNISNHDHSISLTHNHIMPSHTHTFINHTHPSVNHTHSNGTLTVSFTNELYLGPLGTQPDSIEPPPAICTASGGCVISAEESSHRHGTDLTGNTGGGGSGTSTPNGAGTSGASSVDSLSSATASGQSSSSGADTSTSVTQLPPYFTVSFLIKT